MKLLKRISRVFLYLVISLIVGVVVSVFIAGYCGYNVFEVMFWIGLVIAGFGITLSMSSDPKMHGGCLANQYLLISLQKESKNHWDNFKKYPVCKSEASDKCIASAGALLIFLGYFLR